MKTLQLTARATAAPAQVDWVCGTQQGSVILTELPDTLSAFNRLAAAELVTAAYLLNHQRIVGKAWLRPGKAELVFSNRAAMQAAQGRGIPALTSWARPLRVRFESLPMRTNVAGLPETSEAIASRLKAKEPVMPRVEVLGRGLVTVTRHALDQFKRRFNLASREQAWDLIERWGRFAVTELSLPELIQQKKAQKYPQAAVHLKDSRGTCGTIVNRTLVTMFWRHH